MGAGASASEMESRVSVSVLERDGIIHSFQTIDKDHSGQLDKPEFKLAAKALSIDLDDDALELLFEEVDKDKSGTVDHAEFVKFCVESMRKSAPGTLPEGTDTSTIANVLSAEQAQHGFKIAHLILDVNPSACKKPMALSVAGSPWSPLHYLLTLDCSSYARGGGASPAAATDAAYRASATPLILRILKIHPVAASQRTMEGVRWPMGSLPLEYAISRHWDVEVVDALIKAYPLALNILDPIKKTKGFDPKKAYKATSIKGHRWMRQIAETVYPPSPPEILRLLPKPSKDSPPKWVSGEQIEAEEKQKAEEKAAKELKKREKAEKKAAALAAKKEKAEKKKRKSEGGGEAVQEEEEGEGGSNNSNPKEPQEGQEAPSVPAPSPEELLASSQSASSETKE